MIEKDIDFSGMVDINFAEIEELISLPDTGKKNSRKHYI